MDTAPIWGEIPVYQKKWYDWFMKKKTYFIIITVCVVGGGTLSQILESRCTGDCSGLGYTLGLFALLICVILLASSISYFGSNRKGTIQATKDDLKIINSNGRLDFHKTFGLVIFIFLIVILIYCIKQALPYWDLCT